MQPWKPTGAPCPRQPAERKTPRHQCLGIPVNLGATSLAQPNRGLMVTPGSVEESLFEWTVTIKAA